MPFSVRSCAKPGAFAFSLSERIQSPDGRRKDGRRKGGRKGRWKKGDAALFPAGEKSCVPFLSPTSPADRCQSSPKANRSLSWSASREPEPSGIWGKERERKGTQLFGEKKGDAAIFPRSFPTERLKELRPLYFPLSFPPLSPFLPPGQTFPQNGNAPRADCCGTHRMRQAALLNSGMFSGVLTRENLDKRRNQPACYSSQRQGLRIEFPLNPSHSPREYTVECAVNRWCQD